MKRLLLLLLAFSTGTLAQSRIPALISALDSLTLTSYDNWRVSPDLKSWQPNGDPSQPDYDDRAWAALRLDESVYFDSCWVRKEIVLPKAILGTPLTGSVRFALSVDDYGYFWVNGTGLGRFEWDGDFLLTSSAQPAQRFVIAIKAVNTGGPLRLIRAEVRAEQARQLRETVEAVTLSLRTGQKLLSFDTYQTNARTKTDPGIDRTAIDPAERTRLSAVLEASVDVIDLSGLTDGPAQRFYDSVERWKQVVRPVSDFAKLFTLHFTANAHIDAAWLWRERETIEVCRNTFTSANNIMDAKRDATFAQSQAVFYRWMEELHPDVFKRIRDRVKEGRWEIVGGMWVEPDCNLPSGDSWMRQLLYAKRYFRKTFGVDVQLGWNPDSFGYNGNMPMLYRSAGIDAFITQKIGWNDTNVFPHRLFWWESPDGSRILSVFPFDYVNNIGQPHGLVDWLRQFEANTGFRNLIVLFGVGNHGGGPSLEMMRRIDRLATVPIYPKVEFGTARSYLDWIKAQDLSSVPVWKDELYLEYHQGTFTTQAAVKKANREHENLLTGAETFSAVASRLGKPYPADALRTAWETVMFNQFHDILPGSSIREVYVDAAVSNAKARELGEFERGRSLAFLASQINTASLPAGRPVVLFNQLGWDRTDLARVPLPKGDSATVSVFDAKGVEIPSQMVRTGPLSTEVIFVAKIPAIGYATYLLRPRTTKQHVHPLSISYTSLANEHYTVAIDPETGWLKSIVDKRSGREVLAGPGNELQLLEDLPKAWDAWNIGLTGVRFPTRFRRMEIIERGPVRVILRLHHTYLKPGVKRAAPTEDFPTSFFSQDIMLYRGLDRIDFITQADWWEDKTMVKIAFPVTVRDSAATYEIPFGTIRRSTGTTTSVEKAQFEVPSHRWADLSQSDRGVSLLNRSKYGYDIKDNLMRLSLLRSPKWPDPTADRGAHTIEYALLPHEGTWEDANTVRHGYEYNSPLIAVPTDRQRGKDPAVQSLLGFRGDGLVLTSVKKAEEGNAWIMTWYNLSDRTQTAEISLPAAPKAVRRSNTMEEDGESVTVVNRQARVRTPAKGMAVLKVEW
ncbi:MAG: glycosyl hydrolase-related protein [Bacteroidetes bacterium]|jgi:alpha-mannosidase|nr:glycosyl hydrolase-related protein [Bacteroidota bacterium]